MPASGEPDLRRARALYERHGAPRRGAGQNVDPRFREGAPFRLPERRAYYNRGVSHNELCAYERAFSDFGHSLAINPLLVGGHRGRALAYYELGSYGEALEECERVLALKPNDDAALALRKRLCATIEPSSPDVS